MLRDWSALGNALVDIPLYHCNVSKVIVSVVVICEGHQESLVKDIR
jgi:hypothetical protein